MNYSYLFIFHPWKNGTVTGSVMYAVCIRALLLRQHKGMEPNSEIMWVFLKNPCLYFVPFQMACPQPGAAAARSYGVLSFVQPSIFTHGRYLYSCSLLHFLQTTLWGFLQCHAGGKGVKGEWAWGRSLLIDVGDITYQVFRLAGQQHLCHPGEVTTALSHLLGSSHEDRSLSCPRVWCLLFDTHDT